MMNKDLLNAILSMDAYNRGYDQSINLETNSSGESLGISIGNTTITTESDIDPGEPGVNIGFYALAYDVDMDGDGTVDETVISYRGTDYPQVDTLPPRDIEHGWPLGAGNLASEQGLMAVAFYQEVAGDGKWFSSNISLTGHSQGGGLAGFVGALYDKDATIFDTMTFELAAARASNYGVEYVDSNGDTGSLVISPAAFSDFSAFYPDYTIVSWQFQSPDYVQLVYGSNTPVQPDFEGMKGYYVSGEALAGLLGRGNEMPYQELDDLDGIDLIPGINPIDEAVARHSQSTLAILLYKDEVPELTNWSFAAPYFWPVMYDHEFAGRIGMTDDRVGGELQDQSQYADIMRMIIAYSAIESGEMPFGDQSIRMLYDDAHDLGKALQLVDEQHALHRFGTEISQVFVEYAALMALNDIEAESSTALSGARTWFGDEGVLKYRFGIYEEHDWTPNNDTRPTLGISFQQTLVWESATAYDHYPDYNDPTTWNLYPIQSKTLLIDAVLNEYGLRDVAHYHMSDLWSGLGYHDFHLGPGQVYDFDEVVFGIHDMEETNLSRANYLSESFFYVGTDGNDNLIADHYRGVYLMGDGDDRLENTVSSIVFMGDGHDTVTPGLWGGNNVIYGGEGYDVLDLSLVSHRVTVTPEGNGYRVYSGAYEQDELVFANPNNSILLVNFEEVIGPQGDNYFSYFHFGSTPIAFRGNPNEIDSYFLSKGDANIGDTPSSEGRIIPSHDESGIRDILHAPDYTRPSHYTIGSNGEVILYSETNVIGYKNSGGGITIHRTDESEWPSITINDYHTLYAISNDGNYYPDHPGNFLSPRFVAQGIGLSWNNNLHFNPVTGEPEALIGQENREDVVDYSDSDVEMDINLTSGNGSGGNAEGDVYNSIEHVLGGADDDTITGNGDANELNGQNGNDTLSGMGGADILVGSNGVDTADYSGEQGGSGIDADLNAQTVTDSYGDTDIVVAVENIHGTDHDDQITGDGEENFFTGLDGNDELRGGANADILNGGDGADILHVSQDFNVFTFPLTLWETNIGSPNAPYDGGRVAINDYSVTQDVYIGGEGTDILRMSGWNEALFLDSRMVGFSGSEIPARIQDIEIIEAGGGNDFVDLTSDLFSYGDIRIEGGSGDDIIWSSEGDDRLYGGSGSDELFGGAGADIFVFALQGLGSGVDRILDFDQEEGDRLDLSQLLSAFDPVQDAISSFISLTEEDGNLSVGVDTQGGGQYTQLAVLEGVAMPTSANEFLAPLTENG